MKYHPSLIDQVRRALHTAIDETVNLLGYLCLSTAELATKSDIQHLENKIMSAISDFATAQNAFNDQIDTAVTGLSGDVKNLTDQIAALQNSNGAITAADQALLDGIQARAKAVADKLTALDALTPPVAPTGGGVPVITPVAALNLPVNVAITPVQVVASNSPTAYAALGLPFGLSIDSSTGAITGTPTVAGTSTVAITVTNAAGSASASVVINVQ